MDDLHEESNEFSEMFQIELQIYNKAFFLSIFAIWFLFILFSFYILFQLFTNWLATRGWQQFPPFDGSREEAADSFSRHLQARSGFA